MFRQSGFCIGSCPAGFDLTHYNEELNETRQIRSLNLRRSFNLSKSRACKIDGKFYVTPKRSNVFEIDQFSIEDLLQKLKSESETEIVSACQTIEQVSSCQAKTAETILQNTQIQETFVDLLQEGSKSYTNYLLSCIIETFKYCASNEESCESFIDAGLCSSLMMILSEENTVTIEATARLIGKVSYESAYARDACVCLGIHTMLIEICGKCKGSDIAHVFCEALHFIFGNPEPMDAEVIKDSTTPIVNLLDGQKDDATMYILEVLSDISSKQPSVIFTYYNLGLYSHICELISNPALTGAALGLVGNMSVAQPAQIRELVNNNLIQILMELTTTEFAGDVFWILSNILESFPEIILSNLDSGILDTAVLTAEDSSFDAKREASFFISTLVVFGGNEQVGALFNEDIFSVLSDVLGCGINGIVLRCTDALITFILYAQREGKMDDLKQMSNESGIEDTLRGLEEDNSIIGQRSRYILSQISDQ